MQIDKKTRLHFGCQYQHHAVRTKTTEHVLASRFSENMWKNTDYNDGYFHFIDEKKQLQWDLKINSYTFQIPVVITHRLSRSFVLLFGVNRRMTSWEITDETLAVFDYRDMTIDGEPTHQENFGERYRQPREKKSDVTTLLLGGLTIIPSPVFNIRLLAVPRWVSTYDGTALQGFQWWIHFNLTQ